MLHDMVDVYVVFYHKLCRKVGSVFDSFHKLCKPRFVFLTLVNAGESVNAYFNAYAVLVPVAVGAVTRVPCRLVVRQMVVNFRIVNGVMP